MTRKRITGKAQSARKARAARGSRATPYHHGALREALLMAAERLLERDGIAGLTLRAAAREAGVSHAAPMNHFGDIRGLLSELAALGFERFRAMMVAQVRDGDSPSARMEAIGRGYVLFARAHPSLFLLMFRGERLDATRPALREAMDAAFRVLAGTVGARREEAMTSPLEMPQAAHVVAAWSLVHGFAMLLLDGRLSKLLAQLPDGADEMVLLNEVVQSRGPDSTHAQAV